MAAKVKALLNWCKIQCEGYKNVSVTNFTSSWKSGLAFCAIIHRYRPDLIDYDSLSPNDTYGNSKLAFDVGSSLGIPALLDPEDMVVMTVPDKLCIITYVSQYYNHLHNKPKEGGPGVKAATKRALNFTHTNELPPEKKPTPSSSLHLQENVKRGTLDDKCCSCKKKVYLLERQVVEGKLYHHQCMRELNRISTLQRNKETEQLIANSKLIGSEKSLSRAMPTEVYREKAVINNLFSLLTSNSPKTTTTNISSVLKENLSQKATAVSSVPIISSGKVTSSTTKIWTAKIKTSTSTTTATSTAKTTSTSSTAKTTSTSSTAKTNLTSFATAKITTDTSTTTTSTSKTNLSSFAFAKITTATSTTTSTAKTNLPYFATAKITTDTSTTTTTSTAKTNLPSFAFAKITTATSTTTSTAKTNLPYFATAKITTDTSTTTSTAKTNLPYFATAKITTATPTATTATTTTSTAKSNLPYFATTKITTTKAATTSSSTSASPTNIHLKSASPSNATFNSTRVLHITNESPSVGQISNSVTNKDKREAGPVYKFTFKAPVQTVVTTPTSATHLKTLTQNDDDPARINVDLLQLITKFENNTSTPALSKENKLSNHDNKSSNHDNKSPNNPSHYSVTKFSAAPSLNSSTNLPPSTIQQPSSNKQTHNISNNALQTPRTINILIENSEARPKENLNGFKTEWQIEAERRQQRNAIYNHFDIDLKTQPCEDKDPIKSSTPTDKKDDRVIEKFIAPNVISPVKPERSPNKEKCETIPTQPEESNNNNPLGSTLTLLQSGGWKETVKSGVFRDNVSSEKIERLVGVYNRDANIPWSQKLLRSKSSKNMAVIKRRVFAEESPSEEEITTMLKDLDKKLVQVETEGRNLEEIIRSGTDEIMDEESEEGHMKKWFQLVKQRSDLIREESELIYWRQQKHLEKHHEELEYQFRFFCSIPDDEKTEEDRKIESQLLEELFKTVEIRNKIVDSIEDDRIRYIEEDRQYEELVANSESRKVKKKKSKSMLLGRKNKNKVMTLSSESKKKKKKKDKEMPRSNTFKF